MIIRLLLAFSIPLLVLGCGKKSETAGSPSPNAVATAENPVATAKDQEVPPAPTVSQPLTTGAGDYSAALAELTQAVRKYSIENRRRPNSLSEVVVAGYVRNMPQAPPGKRFEIQPKGTQVVLVNQ